MLGRGEPFGRLGVGVPYYKASYDFFRWWSWLLAGGLRPGDALLNGPEVPGEVPIPLAHNALVRAFLQSEADTLCIIEDDHVGDQDTVRRMREKRANWDFDVVCANYSNRRGDLFVVGVEFTGDVNAYGEVECLLDPMFAAENGTQEVDCAALGLVLVRRWVVEAMVGGEDPEEYHWFDWRGRNSQDVQFYWRVRDTGARVGVDRDTQIGHVGTKVFWPEMFYRQRRRHLESMQEESDG